MGELIEFPTTRAASLTYAQLAKELGVSVRSLKYWRKAGMPDEGLCYDGRRRFNLRAVREWRENSKET
jgi:DNA-binding transcriptional MerR regulator